MWFEYKNNIYIQFYVISARNKCVFHSNDVFLSYHNFQTFDKFVKEGKMTETFIVIYAHIYEIYNVNITLHWYEKWWYIRKVIIYHCCVYNKKLRNLAHHDVENLHWTAFGTCTMLSHICSFHMEIAKDKAHIYNYYRNTSVWYAFRFSPPDSLKSGGARLNAYRRIQIGR